jgi:hypothetical protein
MAYDYSSENKRLELPNPYRVENAVLFLCALVCAAGGVRALWWGREFLQHGSHAALVPVLIGAGLLAAAVGFSVRAARRLRFFFGRGRPQSLAPEVAVGATGNSQRADELKNMLRQGGLVYGEPQGALNGVLYHLVPRLITAPMRVQQMAQRQFFNVLSFAVTLLSFGIGWGLLGTDESRPLIAALYLVFAAIVLLKPLYAGQQARMTSTFLIGLVMVAILGPVLVGWLGASLPKVGWQLEGQTLYLLLAALGAEALILWSLWAQLDASPLTERSQVQLALSMNGPPGAITTELDRRLQSEWTENIPNRRYTRQEPVTHAAQGSGRFAGELLEETQPMPMTGVTAPTFLGALASPRHRGLVLLDVFALALVVAANVFALMYAHSFDPSLLEQGAGPLHTLVGYSLISLALAAFCFQSAGAVWGRFNFESVLVWVEMLGNFQTSRIGTGNAMHSQLHSDNDVVRVESMTLRVWRARLESVVFGKDDGRQVTAMFSTGPEAQQLAQSLADFAQTQSVFVAPGAHEDQRRMASLQQGERLLSGGSISDGGVTAAARLASQGASGAADALRVEAAHGFPKRFCTACGTPAASDAKFCANCGTALEPTST